MTVTPQQILDEINRRCLPHQDVRNGYIESEWAMVEVDNTVWDVEFWTEKQLNGDVIYRITAYPMQDMDGAYVGDYSQLVTLHSEVIS